MSGAGEEPAPFCYIMQLNLVCGEVIHAIDRFYRNGPTNP